MAHRHPTRAMYRALPRHAPHRSCGKRRFGDRIAAELALGRIAAKGDVRERCPVRTYPCPACSGWHLTSKPAGRVPVPRGPMG